MIDSLHIMFVRLVKPFKYYSTKPLYYPVHLLNHIYITHTIRPLLQYTQTMIHSIQNADGTVSIIQVDPNNQIITLPDGTTAQVQGVATVMQTVNLKRHLRLGLTIRVRHRSKLY